MSAKVLEASELNAMGDQNNENDKTKRVINEIDKTVKDALSYIASIKNIAVEGKEGEVELSTKKLKEEVSRELNKVLDRLKDIESVSTAVDGIRNEIIEPVNNAIKIAAKPGETLGIWGIGIGVFGLIVSLVFGAPPFLELFSKPRKSYQQEVTVSEKGIPEIEVLLGRSPESGKVILDAQSSINELESAIISNNSDAIELSKAKLQEVLKVARNNHVDSVDTISLMAYGSALYYSTRSNWNNVIALYQVADTNGYLKGKYGSAIKAHKIYAQSQIQIPTEEKTKLVTQIEELEKEDKGIQFVSPDEKRRVSIREFVQRWKDTLKNQAQNEINKKYLGDFDIWVFDPGKGSRNATSLANEIKSLGFEKVVAKEEHWKRGFPQTVFYFRDGDYKGKPAYKELLNLKGEKFQTSFYWNTKNVAVKDAMKRNPDLDLIVVMSIR